MYGTTKTPGHRVLYSCKNVSQFQTPAFSIYGLKIH